MRPWFCSEVAALVTPTRRTPSICPEELLCKMKCIRLRPAPGSPSCRRLRRLQLPTCVDRPCAVNEEDFVKSAGVWCVSTLGWYRLRVTHSGITTIEQASHTDWLGDSHERSRNRQFCSCGRVNRDDRRWCLCDIVQDPSSERSSVRL